MERTAALEYSKTLNPDGEKKMQEMEEGEEDEMFWLFLGEDDYAKADYWKWKKDSNSVSAFGDPRIWRVDVSERGSEVCCDGLVQFRPLIITSLSNCDRSQMGLTPPAQYSFFISYSKYSSWSV